MHGRPFRGSVAALQRRQIVRVTCLTAIGIGISSCAADSEYDAHSLAQPDLLATLGAGPVRAIGARYRAATSRERAVDALRAAILASRPLRARLLGAGSPPIASLGREDFEKEHTVVVDGWILSVTEARQCALFSLLTA